jgi:hypothetical protein
MKIKHLLLAALSLLTLPVSAEVTTLQGSSRWNTTFFRTNSNTSVGVTNYITYYLIESFNGTVTNQVKIDAWTARNPQTGRTERYYYVDSDYQIEFGYFGRFGTDVGGGMLFDGIEAVVPFRGISSAGRLTSVNITPLADYYKLSNGLDITQITGTARLNTAFSGNVSLNTAYNAVLDFLESRGYFEAN